METASAAAPAPVVVLWCVGHCGQSSFVTAFPEAFVTGCPDRYMRDRRKAEQRHLAGLDYSHRADARFFTTTTTLDVPAAPAAPTAAPASALPSPCPTPAGPHDHLELAGVAST